MDFFTPQFFSTVGFPAALCIYVIFGVNKNIKDLADAINQLNCNEQARSEKYLEKITEQTRKVEHLEDELRNLKFEVENLHIKNSEVRNNERC